MIDKKQQIQYNQGNENHEKTTKKKIKLAKANKKEIQLESNLTSLSTEIIHFFQPKKVCFTSEAFIHITQNQHLIKCPSTAIN